MLGAFTFGVWFWLFFFKLIGWLSISWWLVFLPIMVYLAIVLIVWAVAVIIALR